MADDEWILSAAPTADARPPPADNRATPSAKLTTSRPRSRRGASFPQTGKMTSCLVSRKREVLRTHSVRRRRLTRYEVAPDPTDGAVAAGQSAPPPPEDMGVDAPPAAPPRLLRIKKKQKSDFVPPAGTTAATDSDARASAPPGTKKHAWQHVEHVRTDLQGTFRIRSTEEQLDSVRFYRSADPAATPAEGDTQRGPTQRGSNLKFTVR